MPLTDKIRRVATKVQIQIARERFSLDESIQRTQCSSASVQWLCPAKTASESNKTATIKRHITIVLPVCLFLVCTVLTPFNSVTNLACP